MPEFSPLALVGTTVTDLYLDACCFIYLVEGLPRWRHPVKQRIEALASESRILTSQLSRLECRSKPLRDNDQAALASYDSLFTARRVRLIDIGPEVVDRATFIRAKYNLKSPDALHLASAIVSCATVFLTGDIAISRCSEIDVELIVPDTL